VEQFTESAAFTGLLIALSSLAGCSYRSDIVMSPIESVYTDISAKSCTERIDEDDPNDTTYQLCPGVLGYSIVVRRVGSGRQSVDVRTPSDGDYPLDYQEFVTSDMSQLEPLAEWRVKTSGGTETPIALIIGVQAHENVDEPAEVTQTYLAVAKIAPGDICVTNKVAKRPGYQSTLYDVADAAPFVDCLQSPGPATNGENQ